LATCPTCGTQEVPGQQFCSSCGARSSNAFATPAPLPTFPAETTPTGYTLAGFWKRLLGYLIDYVLLTITGVLILASVHGTFMTAVIIVVALSFLYNSLFIGLVHGQTLGMRLISIKCVDQDGHTEIDYARAAKRALFYSALLFLGNLERLNRYNNPTTVQVHHELHEELVYLLFRIPWLVDLLWVAWDQKNQTLHDKFARTIVISTKSASLNLGL
jgi:uncharacterized RDD family membrane protein YckC